MNKESSSSETAEKKSQAASPSFLSRLKKEWARLRKDRRFQIFVGLFFLLALGLVLLYPHQNKQSEVEKKKSAEQVYVQWSVAMLSGSGSACSYMSEKAQEEFLEHVSLPEETKAKGCDEVVPLLNDSFQLREPYEPYKLIKSLTNSIDRLVVENDTVFIYTTDFALGERPLVVSKETGEWLIAAESFSSLN